MYNDKHMRIGNEKKKSDKFHQSFTQLEKVMMMMMIVMLNFIDNRHNDKQKLPRKSLRIGTIFP